MERVDFAYVLTDDVEFKRDVTLMEIAGELVAPSHPDYPRDEYGGWEGSPAAGLGAAP